MKVKRSTAQCLFKVSRLQAPCVVPSQLVIPSGLLPVLCEAAKRGRKEDRPVPSKAMVLKFGSLLSQLTVVFYHTCLQVKLEKASTQVDQAPQSPSTKEKRGGVICPFLSSRLFRYQCLMDCSPHL